MNLDAEIETIVFTMPSASARGIRPMNLDAEIETFAYDRQRVTIAGIRPMNLDAEIETDDQARFVNAALA